jgi:hypothetical protein
MKTTALALLCFVAAVAAGVFAWQSREALRDASARLASTTAELDKTRSQVQALQSTIEPLRKRAEEDRLAAEQTRSELTTTRAFLEAEKAAGIRLHQELDAMKQLLATAGRSRAPQAVMPSLAPMPIPVIIRGATGKAVSAASPAR